MSDAMTGRLATYLLIAPAVAAAACAMVCAPGAACAQSAPRISPAPQVEQLAEIMGGVHYLQFTCLPGESQVWRDRMSRLLELEAPQAGERRQSFVRAFNRGFTAEKRRNSACANIAASEQRLAVAGRRVAMRIRSLYVE